MKVVLALVLLLAGCSPVSANPPPCHGQVCPPSPPPVAMGRLITAGFETGDALTLEGVTLTGSGSISTDVARTGSRSLKNTASGTMTWTIPGPAVGTTYYARAYIYVQALPAGNQSVVQIKDGSAVLIAALILKSDGTIAVTADGITILGTSTAAIPVNEWHRLELGFKTAAGANDYIEGLLDGVSIASSTTQNRSDAAPTTFILQGANVANTYFDDVAVNDSNGANQNTWPGDGNIALLLPISDSAVGTGWTLGTGTAFGGNGFGSVDNTPPTGVADLAVGSDPKQIRNAASAANSNYDANLTTYTNAGIGAGDTINVLDPIVATAAPVTTSSKQGTVGVASNPAITNIALAAGGTAGAFWSGTAAGTYPTGWKISHGTITYAPSVTLGTSPVMRITQVTASTRIAMVCFMGMYVDYTPAVATQVPYVNPMPPLIAQ